MQWEFETFDVDEAFWNKVVPHVLTIHGKQEVPIEKHHSLSHLLFSHVQPNWAHICPSSTFSPPPHSFYFQRFFVCSLCSIIILACIFCDTHHAMVCYLCCCSLQVIAA